MVVQFQLITEPPRQLLVMSKDGQSESKIDFLLLLQGFSLNQQYSVDLALGLRQLLITVLKTLPNLKSCPL